MNFYPKGFNFIEVVTILLIAGVLTVVGINSYKSRKHQARSVSAKHSLSKIYAAEKMFERVWDTYHENLVVIGAEPVGEIWYDTGFSDSASNTPVANYPYQNQLHKKECYTFDQICSGQCESKLAQGTGKPASHYGGFKCKVIGGLAVKGFAASGYGAGTTTFKAMARAKLVSDDVWSINEKQEIKHEKDGTE